ncbi:MAG TPA: SDR family NAD(P)-dependent oxidoreductase, partial [Kineosporiaceae bacterium]|nr:SDR family NAD(P)-dependent oxidoreductase [Kineosporiaceae bacterium]
MIDALGRPQSVLLLGGTSEIGLAIVRALPQDRVRRVVLAGRDRGRLEAVGRQLTGASSAHRPQPGPTVEVVELDAVVTDSHAEVVDAVFDAGDVDVTVVAVGALGDQAAAEADPALAVRSGETNFVGPLSLMLHVGRRLRAQGHGVLVVL